MLIDDLMPEYDFSERHAVEVSAGLPDARAAIREWRPDSSLLWRLLLRFRGLGRPAGTLREWAEAMGFLCLGETENEVLYGQIGRFWALNERQALAPQLTAEAFRRFKAGGYAVAVMNVLLVPFSIGETRISTETRVHALDRGARRRFRLYWLFIRPFSGLLRGAMLRGMASRATSDAGRHVERSIDHAS